MSTLWSREFFPVNKWLMCLAALSILTVRETVIKPTEIIMIPTSVMDQYPMFIYIAPIFLLRLFSIVNTFDHNYVIVRYASDSALHRALQKQVLLFSTAYVLLLSLWMSTLAFGFARLGSHVRFSLEVPQLFYLLLRFLFFAEFTICCKPFLKKDAYTFLAIYGVIAIEFVLFTYGAINSVYMTPQIASSLTKGNLRQFGLEVGIYLVGSFLLALLRGYLSKHRNYFGGEQNG